MKSITLALILMFTSSFAQSFERFKTPPAKNYVAIPVQQLNGELIQTPAVLKVPKIEEQQLPAVIILHSSIGVDSTGDFYAKRLNAAGFVTLELDLWSGRGLAGSLDRPETPFDTLPDLYSALLYLAQMPNVDPQKIGVIGFSWGGVMSMLSATQQVNSIVGAPLTFAAHVAHYPICYGYNVIPGFDFKHLTGSPVLVQAAEFDEYDYPGACEAMVSQIPASDQALVEVIEYPGVYHTWDRLEPEIIVEDPFAHLGQGGQVTLSPDVRTALRSRYKVVSFFKQHLK